MKKIIAIPDLHLDKTFNVTYGDSTIWQQKAYDIVASIFKKEVNKKKDEVIFLGDIFNTTHPSFHSIFKFLSLIEGYNVTIISGNHDVPKTKKYSVMDYLHEYATIVDRNTVSEVCTKNIYAIGWCDTQSMFEAKLKATIEHISNTLIFLHASYPGWDNEMDNCLTKELLDLAKKNDIKLISGHEHKSNIVQDTLYHLGAIMPMNIGELGNKYYWTSLDGRVLIDHSVGNLLTDDIIVCRDDIGAQGDKPVTIRPKKTTVKDLELEEKELSIDILDDFKKEAAKEGFDEEFIKGYL